MSDVEAADPAAHPAVDDLFDAWHTIDGRQRRRLVERHRPPGPIALRSRYRHMLDPTLPDGAQGSVPRHVWDDVLRLETAGDEAVKRGRWSDAERAFRDLQALAGGADGVRIIAVHVQLGLGDVARAHEAVDEALEHYEAALATARADAYRFGVVRALVPVAYVALQRFTAGAALDLFDESARVARELGDPVYTANAELGRAECQERLGDLPGAIASARAARDSFVAVGAPLGVANAAERLGALLHRTGDLAGARDSLAEALAVFVDIGDPNGVTNALGGLGDVLLDAGDHDEAEQLYTRALRAAQDAALPRSEAHALQNMGRVARSRRQWELAEQRFRASLDAYRGLDELMGAAYALGKIAETHTERGDHRPAAERGLEAVFAVEEYRATHQEDRAQTEYRARFRQVYSDALTAAVRADAADIFAVVADCLAGRRLAGLFAAERRPDGQGEIKFLQDLVVRADQRWVANARDARDPRDPTAALVASDDAARQARVARFLGALSIRHGLTPQVESSFDDLLATVYLPPADDGPDLLAALPTDCDTLQVVVDPARAGIVHWLWRTGDDDGDGEIRLGSSELSSAATELIGVLQGDSDDRRHLGIDDLRPMTEVLPPALIEELSTSAGRRLLVLPVGELWLVPWGALPIDGRRTLGEAVAYMVCPSLTIQRQLQRRGRQRSGAGDAVLTTWRSPYVDHHQLSGLQVAPRWTVEAAPSAAAARDHLRAGHAAVLVVAHGRLVEGVGHYIELDGDQWLLPADLIDARPPDVLVLITCWGAGVPGRATTDPISIATLALAGGSTEVVATVGEFGDSLIAEKYVERLVAELARTRSAATAVHLATTWALADVVVRREGVLHWAPLIPFGTFGPVAPGRDR
jgi:tetratricopeptide (TPR) repeat protein